VTGLAACSETPLNVAPVVDHSHPMNAGLVPAPSEDGTYVVRQGDTLFRIAMSFHCGLRELARWNGIDENAPIRAGQRLRVRDPALPAAAPTAAAPPAPMPAGGVPAAQKMDDADTPAVVHAVPLAALPPAQTHMLETAPLAPLAAGAGAAGAAPAAAASAMPALPAAPAPAPAPVTVPAPAPAPITVPSPAMAPSAPDAGVVAMPADPQAWIWPADGRVLTNFDPVHGKGIDIGVTEDAPVRAVADGVVSYTGAPLDYGNLVILEHSKGLRSVYAHVKSIAVQQGQTVSRGQVVATGGKTGAGVPLVHFEVRQKGVPIDPLGVLPPH
jgi:lipoprotein NlpD